MAILDWALLARGALWMAGLSTVLAAWSYAYWQAHTQRVRLREALGRFSFQLPFNGGLALFAGGLAWSAATRWEQLVWLALALVFAWQAVAGGWSRRRQGRAQDS